MDTFIYNDIQFAIDKSAHGWTIARRLPDGGLAVIGAGLYRELPDAEAIERAQALAMAIFPVGIRIVGPDVAHPNMVGELRIVGPDVVHPNFIYWNKDSTSLSR